LDFELDWFIGEGPRTRSGSSLRLYPRGATPLGLLDHPLPTASHPGAPAILLDPRDGTVVAPLWRAQLHWPQGHLPDGLARDRPSAAARAHLRIAGTAPAPCVDFAAGRGRRHKSRKRIATARISSRLGVEVTRARQCLTAGYLGVIASSMAGGRWGEPSPLPLRRSRDAGRR